MRNPMEMMFRSPENKEPEAPKNVQPETPNVSSEQSKPNLENTPDDELLKSLIPEEDASKLEMVKRFERVSVMVGPFMVNVKVGLLNPFLDYAQKDLVKEQHGQQKKVEEYFQNDPSIEVESFYRNPDASGNLDMSEELKKAGEDTNKIVLLLNGVVNPQDVVQASPRLARVMTALLRVHPLYIAKYGLNAKKILKGDSISDYIINTTKAVQTKLFNGEKCKVLIVRNAGSKDLSAVVENGGEKTVMVVGGHGDFGSLSMTDKTVSSEDIPNPPKRLKAFVQHTCAMKKDKEQEEMGKRFAKNTFGWNRLTSPLDFIENPLRKRSQFDEE